jgi:ABC exporter DevB family membrane fusion protein
VTTLSVRVVPVLLIGVSVGAAAVIAFQQLTTPPSALESSPTDGGGKADREAIIAIGTIEPKAGMLDISSSLIGHRIKAVHVNEAQPVEADEILIEIDDELIGAERELALAQQSDAAEQQAAHVALAKEQVLLTELALKELKAGSQLEIATQQAQFAVLENKEKQAERDRDRLQTLNGLLEPRVSTQQVEQQELLLDLAKAETQAADAGIMQLKQTLTFKKQTAEAELRMAKRKLEQANAGSNVRTLKEQVRLANIKLQQTKIVAPVSGFVLNVHTQDDELVGQRPLLTFADLSQFVCVMEIDIADIRYLFVGQKVEIMGGAFGDEDPEPLLYGTIERIGRMVNTASLQPLSPLEPVDRRVVKVVAEIDSGNSELSKIVGSVENGKRPALVGLQVRVRIPIDTNR